MAKKETFSKLAQILSDQLKVDIDFIKEESILKDDLGADSLDTAEIAMIIKEQFNYDLSEEEIKKIKTVNDIIKCIEENSLKKGL